MSKQLQNQEEEIDLGGFFNQIGKLIGKLFQSIGLFFKWLYHLLIVVMVFVKKNFVKLSIGAILGIILGILANKYIDKTYLYEMVIIPNYESGTYIINKLDYYNQLIEQKNYSTLSNIFGIDKADAMKIKNFEFEGIEDKKDLVEGYDELVKKSDTTTINELSLKNYLNPNFSTFYFKKYIIRMYTSQPTLKKNISEMLIKDLEKNDYLNEKRNLTLQSISIRDSAYNALLKIIDTIIVKDKKIALVAASSSNSNSSNINLNNKESYNKDYELLALYKETSAEIAFINEGRTKYNTLFQVVAPLEPIGNEDKTFFLTTFFKVFSIIMFITVLIILFNPFINYLNNYSKK